MNDLTVAVLGASPKKDRYSNMAIHKLSADGYKVLPVHPAHEEIDGHKVYKNLNEISDVIHTITLYVSPKIGEHSLNEIIKINPKRVIFNPGTESPTMQKALQEKGVEVIEACTLVMLASAQF